MRKIRLLVIAILLPATLILFYNNTTNRHYHLLPDGEYILVAHPFTKQCKDPLNPKETTSKKELIILSYIISAITSSVAVLPYCYFETSIPFLQFFAVAEKIIKIQVAQKNKSPPFVFTNIIFFN